MDPIPVLRKFLSENKLTQAAAAKRLGVSAPTFHDWMTKAKRPTAVFRAAIERLTSGAVPATSWETARERRLVDRVQPVSRLAAVVPAPPKVA